MTSSTSSTSQLIWTIRPGDLISRNDVKRRYGGDPQGGISPSTTTPNIMLFWGDAKGKLHGYIDGWKTDGLFDYSGTGRLGDQGFHGRNASVLRHLETGKALRLFKGTSGIVTYIGQFELDGRKPYYRLDSPETQGGPLRSIIVFRLRPVDPPLPTPSRIYSISDDAQVTNIPIEKQHSETHLVSPSSISLTAARREAILVLSLKAFLDSRGFTAIRNSILAPGTLSPMLTDLFIPEMNLLIEAKGTVERQAFRQALGQLADYRRFLKFPFCAILIPSRPSDDLVNLASIENIQLIWPDNDTFANLLFQPLLPSP